MLRQHCEAFTLKYAPFALKEGLFKYSLFVIYRVFVIDWTRFPQDIYRTHSGRDEFLERGRTGSWGRKREELSLHSDGHFFTQDFQIILSSNSLLAHYAIWCCIQSDARVHTRWTDKLCKKLKITLSSIFLPLVTALKAAPWWIVFFFTWPLLLQESCPGPEKCVQVKIWSYSNSINKTQPIFRICKFNQENSTDFQEHIASLYIPTTPAPCQSRDRQTEGLGE